MLTVQRTLVRPPRLGSRLGHQQTFSWATQRGQTTLPNPEIGKGASRVLSALLDKWICSEDDKLKFIGHLGFLT
jgi:hypothetical protein